MHPVETCLEQLREIRSIRGGVKETTYCTVLANLIDAVGNSLKLRVQCNRQL